MLMKKKMFKVVIGFEEEVKIDSVRIGTSISNEIRKSGDTKQYSATDYQYYYIYGNSIEIERPSDYFILTLDEESLPTGYRVDCNNVFISDDTNIHKFNIIRESDLQNIDEVINYNFEDECEIESVDADTYNLLLQQSRSQLYVNQGRFYVYYDSSVTNGSSYANDVLDAVSDIEDFFAYYGFEEPYSNQNNDLYIYLLDDYSMEGNYGSAVLSNDGSTLIKINLDLFGIANDSEAFMSTLAHEYSHASVNAYAGGHQMIGGWFFEAFATAVGLYYVSESNIESDHIKTVYDSRLHWHYVNSHQGIEDSNNRYNNFIFVYYLIQEKGLDFIDELYEMQLGHAVYVTDIDYLLSTSYSCLDDEYVTFCEYNLDPKENYDVLSFYSDDWVCFGEKCAPNVHSIAEEQDSGYFDLDNYGSFYISIKAYEGNMGCSNYEGQITFVLPDYQGLSIYAETITENGVTYYEELSIPTTPSNILGGHAVVLYVGNLGSAYCKEMRFVIANYSEREIIGSYNAIVRHKVPSIYESYSVVFGNILNDLNYLKFVPYDTDLYQFDLYANNGSTISNEIVIEDDNFTEIYRFEYGNINLLAHNNSFANSFTCYLEAGEKYYIVVSDNPTISTHSLNINRSFSGFTPSAYNPFGVTNYYFTKGDKIFTFVVPQAGNYNFTFNINFNLYYDMYFVVYKANQYGLSIEDYDIINSGNQTSTLTIYFAQGETVYVGYYDYHGGETSTFNLIVQKS